MKKIIKSKILITIVFLGIAAMTVFGSDYVASYYEKLGNKVPSWIKLTLYPLVAALLLAGGKFAEVFSGKNDQ
jgi:hypothetical protein